MTALQILLTEQNIGQCKLTELKPYLEIIAKQNKLNLKFIKDFKRARRLLNISIIQN